MKGSEPSPPPFILFLLTLDIFITLLHLQPNHAKFIKYYRQFKGDIFTISLHSYLAFDIFSQFLSISNRCDYLTGGAPADDVLYDWGQSLLK
jgi:hypothetical protein